MSSDNLTGADNQQETRGSELELDPLWVVGFVDGEGCFCVSVHRNPQNARRTGGWQLHPMFQVTQHQRHRVVLEELMTVFTCGRVRPKGPKSSVLVYAVDSLDALEGFILPFFEQHPLMVKQADFRLFAEIVRSMRRKEHLHEVGFERLLRPGLCDECRRQAAGALTRAGSSGILRDCTPGVPRLLMSRTKVQSDLHGDMQSQAEMTWPLDHPLDDRGVTRMPKVAKFLVG